MADRKGALVLLFNQDFMIGSKVLLHSLRRSPALSKMDIVIITDDEVIAQSSEFKEIAKIIRFVSPEEKERFSLLPRESINEVFHLSWAPKYTFLKFFIYDNFGYDYHLYLDSDIICTSNADSILDIFFASEANIMGGPVFPRSIARSAEGDRYSQEITYRNLLNYLEAPKGNLNTGVLIYDKTLMSPRIGDALIEIARVGGRPNEQSIVQNFLSNSPDIKFEKLNPLFNFRSSYLRSIDRKHARQLVRQIKFLHFIANHPWSQGATGGFPARLWQEELASMESSAAGSPPADRMPDLET
jgi:Lipopolysaccharide biosynthesis proteins, LPS:glycosyltransferases